MNPANADTLELNVGKMLKGQYMGGTQETVRFHGQGDIKVAPREDILALAFTVEDIAVAKSAGKSAIGARRDY
ncbi:MAG: hypothetical protein LJE85_00525 [Gammaproteobacteria bacterium]|nr:hypothetical protein [Gammaproteobacteria bacterium]